MLMPQSDRKKIYERLFEDGVCIAKKDYNLKSHPEIEGVKNLHVIKAMKSLASRGHVSEQFIWRHYYFSLTDTGIVYLREFLGLAEEVVPGTHKPQKSDMRAKGFIEKQNRGFGRSEVDRGSYRGADADKVTEAGPGAVPVGGTW
uniref:Plectin/S10 N-terminal domain-containing protein n=2 Tax=Acrobeloides nanus TaxID=290746 RepID=A0A914DT66_9BILA